MTARTTNEAQSINRLRNALLVAGHEMGKDGDHWPLIKATIFSIIEDWEQVQIERNVDAEMKIHLYKNLEDMERGLDQCTAEARPRVAQKLKELREVYDAYFAGVDYSVVTDDYEVPAHIKHAKAIIDTLEDANA